MITPIRIVVVDDQTLVREGIRSLLALSSDVEVVGECADGDEALRFLAVHEVDVVLLDLRMPGRDGISTLQEMRERGIDTPVLVLTTFDDDDLVLAALQAGAKGYLLKAVTLEQLLGAVRTLAAGGTQVQPSLTDRLLRAVARTETAAQPPHDPLTSREIDVLRLAAAGWSNRQIAQGLHLAEGTVKNHMSSVLLKLGVNDRVKAVLKALESGLLVTHPSDGG
ncbi:response regulator transcription factor [Microbacterium sp. CFH 90308]|uniref:Response regulator transcription factor n=1 Tax=Microbacterium salsuginis TaxID=2722803 RepID=A0ABX1KA07_9MICO|nr:response regulator transcription factor [Microbacterium sp. CFH 90308]NLP83245.1 response regulator transcription factor [Microbacterium sp. CFH 90308]